MRQGLCLPGGQSVGESAGEDLNAAGVVVRGFDSPELIGMVDDVNPDAVARTASRRSLPLLYLPFLVLLVIPFLVGEEFPVSPFPMYDQWNPESYLVYFMDKNGKAVPIQVITGYKAGRYRKMFDRQQRILKAELAGRGVKKNLSDFGPEEWRPCGIWLLDWIDRSCEERVLVRLEPLRPLQVVRRDLRLEAGKVVHRDIVVATDTQRVDWPRRARQK